VEGGAVRPACAVEGGAVRSAFAVGSGAVRPACAVEGGAVRSAFAVALPPMQKVDLLKSIYTLYKSPSFMTLSSLMSL
jgi:hypothetical protein